MIILFVIVIVAYVLLCLNSNWYCICLILSLCIAELAIF